MTNQIKEQFSKQFYRPWGFLTFFDALSDELYCITTHIHEWIFLCFWFIAPRGKSCTNARNTFTRVCFKQTSIELSQRFFVKVITLLFDLEKSVSLLVNKS